MSDFHRTLKDIAAANEEARREGYARVLRESSADPSSPDHTRENLPGELWRALE